MTDLTMTDKREPYAAGGDRAPQVHAEICGNLRFCSAGTTSSGCRSGVAGPIPRANSGGISSYTF